MSQNQIQPNASAATTAQTGTITAAQFAEEQYTQRRRNEVAALIKSIERLLEDEQNEYNVLEEAMDRNQELLTSEERRADGFSVIYQARADSEHRVCNLKNALAALRAHLTFL